MPRKAPSISVGSPRKRREPVDPDAAAEFEARVEEEGRALKAVPTPESISLAESKGSKKKRQASTKAPSNRKGTVQSPYVRKSDGVATVALTFTVPADLARRIKVHAAMTGVKSSDIGVEALEQYLEAQSTEAT